jgi:glycosyltransferase involved in cell wall biosynthesis/predicted SAM-dependent methyltransferase
LQKLDIPFEVICTDDGSTDSTRDILSYCQKKLPNFQVYYHDRNKGGAAARNTCVAKSRGDLIFCLDSDNILAPDSVGKLIKLLDTIGCDGASFAELRYFKGTKGSYKHSHSWFFEAPDGICDLSHILSTSKTPAASGNYLFTRKSYDRAGGYPSGCGAMDAWGFGFRQHATGAKIAVLSGSFYWHRISADSYWTREEKKGDNGKNAAKILREFPELFTDETNKFLTTAEVENYFFKCLNDGRFVMPGEPWRLTGTVSDIRRDCEKKATLTGSDLTGDDNLLNQFKKLGIWKDDSPLRLHLGCGEQHLQGYVNIDYPQSEHTVMKPAADFRADILDLSFPPATVDEVRLHHVFEHFDRVEGLGLLIRWHSWLKTGGIIRIETPDLIGSVKVLLSQQSWKTKMGIVRHLSGDHTSSWGYHVDHWFAERFERTLGRLGFDNIKVSHTSWPHEPFLANVEITAVKAKNISFEEQKKTAEEMLWDSAINTSPESKRTWQAWSNRLDKFLGGQTEAKSQPLVSDDYLHEVLARVLCDRGSQLPIDQITGFNQRSRDRWMAEMAASVPPGSKVLDMGAGTCPYRTLFSHCDYKTHDFKKLEKIELKDTKGYGRIDYVSDITNIPVDDASFDVVICTEVLEHTPEPAKAIAEIARILRPGGRLFLTAPLGSGLHQLPFHFYGGFTPQWYKHFLPRFGLELEEIQPNGGFFKLMAQECARVAWTMPKHRALHGENADVIEYMFGQAIPRYLFALDERCFIDQFTIGYHVRAAKTQKPVFSRKDNTSEGAGRTDTAPTAEITALIFSKDRALQLQATIESFLLHCRDSDVANLVVLFKTSDALHQKQYEELKLKFPTVTFVEETDFRQQVLSAVEQCKYVLFLVDDNIFVKPFSLKDVVAALDSEKNAIGFSLRLGKNTRYCYMLSSPQKLPAFESVREGIFRYYWPGAEHDFGYPLEVSSSVYRSIEILNLLNQLEYSNPNTLEDRMSQNIGKFASSFPVLLTFDESVTFCNPVNIVQHVYESNKFGTTRRYTPEQLAEGFSRGMVIDVQRYAGFTPDSAHQEAELYFTPDTRVKAPKPKFSILMANFNNGKLIAQAVASVLNQTLKDWELIIIDDCSTDDSVDVINRFLTDGRIRLIRHDTNKGYVAVLKTAIAAVKSELFGILDSDDCLAAHAVETMYRHHILSPDCGFIYSQFIHCDENLRSKQLGFCRAIPAGKTTLDMQAVSHFKTFKLRDYLKTSGFDESMRYAEDKDIIYKMEEVTQLKFVDDCLYLYRDLPHSQSHDAHKAAIGLESVKRAKSAALQRRERTHKAAAFLTSIGRQNSRPKVALVSTTDKRGGAAKVAWMLKQGLAANGFQTKMFVKDKFSDDADVLKISSSGLDRAKELERQGLLYYDIKSTSLLAHNRDFTGCDVFHFHNLHGGYFNPFALAGLSRLKPSVWTLHDMQAITGHCAHSFDCNKWQTGCGNCPNLKIYPAITIDQTARMLEDKRRIYAESNVEIIVPSQWLKDIVAKSILKDKKVHLIYNGIDERIYRPYDKSAVRRQLKLPEDAIIIGFASPRGLVEQFKGGDYILGAYNYFVSKYPNLYFMCVGGKAENVPTERFIQIPFVTDETVLAQIYCAADLFMYPSVADNCPLIVLELMGCGVPIVSFEVGGVPELIENGKTGLLAPYRDTKAIVQMVEQMILDEAGRRRFGQAAIERLRERFKLDRMIANHIRLYENLAQNRLSGQSEQGDEKPVVFTGQTSTQNRYLVSAIVSTYNSEKFIRGCLEDLENQTIADRLEIIVVNSDSEQDEESIVKEFQKKYSNIVYIKTNKREGLYAAWNRAIKVASGRFLTNANTDDRHRKDALEVMVNTLIANPDVALVYGDQIITDTPNSTFENHRVVEMANWPEFSRERLLFGCCVGSQPMWRKSLHDEFGGFDETLTCAADWDFWIKAAGRYSFRHIPQPLGLYYRNPGGIEHGRRIHSLYERYAVGRRYGKPYISTIRPYEAGGNPLVSVVMAAYNAAGYIAGAIESVLIQSYRSFELIVVDDGSTDRTADIVRGFKSEPIKYFYKENGGVASARNYALKKAGGSFVVILDSDDMITPDFLARHLMVFEEHPETDLVYCDDCFIDEEDKPVRVMKRPEYSDSKAIISGLFHYGWAILPFRTCIRKSVFDKIGLYDERLIMSEDYDMVRRFVSQGLRMRHLPAALYLRHPTTNSLSRSFNAAKAKSHFNVVRRFTETFTPEQLFPDVHWENLTAEQRTLLAKCKTAIVYLGIGEQYLASGASDFAEKAYEMAGAELDDCCKIAPANHHVRNLREKCRFIREKHLSSNHRQVYQPV